MSATTALLVAWWVFASFGAPELIRLTHQGQEIPFFGALMEGVGSTPVEGYLERWWPVRRGVALLLGVVLAAGLPLALLQPRSRRLAERRLSGFIRAERPAGWLLAGLLLAGVAALAYVAHAHPLMHVYVTAEDRWVEYATFAAYLIAAVIVGWAAVVDRRYRRPGFIALVLVAFLIGMDEISWGQRILELETPELFEEVNLQNEITLHNIWFPAHAVIGLLALAFGVLLPKLAERWGALEQLAGRLGVPLPGPWLRPFFGVAGGLLILADVAPRYLMFDELSELALGISIGLLALGLAAAAVQRARPAAAVLLSSAAGFLLTLTLVSTALVHWASSPDTLSYRLHARALDSYPEHGLHDQAGQILAHLYERPHLQTSWTLVRYGRHLMERGNVERGREVLHEALAADTRRAAEVGSPGPTALRRRIVAFRLLGMEEGAEWALSRALAMEEGRLAELEEDEARASVHWSMALTLDAAGHGERALKEAAIACRLAVRRQLVRDIRRWRDADECSEPSLAGALRVGRE